MISPMPRTPRHLHAAVILLGLGQAAHAACTDTPAPAAQWRRCLLDGTDLTGANLERSKLSGVIAVRADFTDAIMKDCKLVRANLKQASMSGANLAGADLSGADLSGADMRDCWVMLSGTGKIAKVRWPEAGLKPAFSA